MDFKWIAKTLFSLSAIEEKRVTIPHSDPRMISPFKEIESLVDHSLKKPNLMRTQTQTGVTLPQPKLEKRALRDETLLQKLVQFRHQFPTSGRIIRKQDS